LKSEVIDLKAKVGGEIVVIQNQLVDDFEETMKSLSANKVRTFLASIDHELAQN